MSFIARVRPLTNSKYNTSFSAWVAYNPLLQFQVIPLNSAPPPASQSPSSFPLLSALFSRPETHICHLPINFPHLLFAWLFSSPISPFQLSPLYSIQSEEEPRPEISCSFPAQMLPDTPDNGLMSLKSLESCHWGLESSCCEITLTGKVGPTNQLQITWASGIFLGNHCSEVVINLQP